MKMDIKAILDDLKCGLTDREIISKHGLSEEELNRFHRARVKAESWLQSLVGGSRKDLKYDTSASEIGKKKWAAINSELIRLREDMDAGMITREKWHEQIKVVVSRILDAK